MHPFLAGAYATLRRKLSEDQGRPPRNRVPMWRLLSEEAVLLARRLVSRPAWWVPVVVAAVVFVGLLPATPGPSLDVGWRVVAAVAVLVIGTALGRRLRSGRR